MNDEHGAYWQGKIDTELCAVKETLERMEQTLRDHIADESRRLDAIQKEINALKLWKASVLGLAAGIALMFSAIGTWFGKALR